MEAGPVVAELQKAVRTAARRQRWSHNICTTLAALLGGLIGAVAGQLLGEASLSNKLSFVLSGGFCGTSLGLLGMPWLWQRLAWLTRNCRQHAAEQLLERGLLLMVLEPVPSEQLLAVFAVPGHEHAGRGRLALPQTPRALNTQNFAQRLRLLLERYPQASRALGLAPWPAGVLRMQTLLLASRAALPVCCALLILPGSIVIPIEVLVPLLALLLGLLIARAAAEDMLLAQLNAALVDAVAAALEPTQSGESPAPAQ